MYKVERLLVRMIYTYARLSGVLNFEIDTATGQPRTTRRASLYAAFANVLLFSVLPMGYSSGLLDILWNRVGFLHEYVILMVLGLRISCVCVTLLSRWWQRERHMRLVNEFRQLILEHPEVISFWRRGLILKFISVSGMEIGQIIVGLLSVRAAFSFSLVVILLMLSTMTALLNIFITHFFFGLLNIHGHYVLLNRSLRSVMAQTRALESEQRHGSFMSKCCSLADQLEDIALRQCRLQALTHSMMRVFELQLFCIWIAYYMSNVGGIYFAVLNHRVPTFVTTWLILLSGAQMLFYIMDTTITTNMMYQVLDDHAELQAQLAERTLFRPGLDQRLEAVYESFQLQLARNPLRLNVLHFFDIKRSAVISMASSMITNSIVLIQYDIKYDELKNSYLGVLDQKQD
ncbi:putative gustatory receptor 59d [Drosophila busckii]|uniref:putative gustatory receptor 59d n=1 Tax=Drosophila busckii TaxID=30019 RepID=UPI00083EBA8A|nr:putative gustatory receptor 59d [Drosophila busckii]